MMSMGLAAKAEFQKRSREVDAHRLEHEQQLCEEAIRDAYQVFGFYADTAIYNPKERRVELEFDRGAVKIARTNPGCPSQRGWRMILECPDCGMSLEGPAVESLADVGEVLEYDLCSLKLSQWDGHHCYCIHEQATKETI